MSSSNLHLEGERERKRERWREREKEMKEVNRKTVKTNIKKSEKGPKKRVMSAVGVAV